MDRGTRWFFYGFAFVVLLVVASESFAQSTDSCQLNSGVWRKFAYNDGSPDWRANTTAACADARAQICPNEPTSSRCVNNPVWYGYGVTDPRCRNQALTSNLTSSGVIIGQVQSDPATQCPPAAVECNASYVGTKLASFTNPGEEVPLSVCDPSSNCVALSQPGSTICSDTRCGTQYKIHSQEACSNADPNAPAPPSIDAEQPSPSEQCATRGGAEYCISTAADTKNAQCGFLNDQYICLSATPSKGCQAVGGGGVLCDPAASTPPAPDNGTSGVPATPDGQVTAATTNNNSTTTTYNYYSSTTVNASSRPPTTGQQDQGNDTNGDGFTDSEEAQGNVACDGAECFGGTAQEELADYQTATTGYMGRIQAAPIVEAISSISAPSGGGTCPSWSFSVFGSSFNISAGCEYMGGIAPILELAFMAGWCLLGVRIVLGA